MDWESVPPHLYNFCIIFIIFIYFMQFLYILYILYNFYIFYILFIYFIYYLYIFIFYIYSIYLYICTLYIFPMTIYLYTYIYSTHPIPLYILYISYIIHTPLCITSAEGDLSLRDKHLSVVFSLRSKPNKQFNVSFHNYSLGKNFTFIYIILVEFFTNPLLNTLS